LKRFILPVFVPGSRDIPLFIFESNRPPEEIRENPPAFSFFKTPRRVPLDSLVTPSGFISLLFSAPFVPRRCFLFLLSLLSSYPSFDFCFVNALAWCPAMIDSFEFFFFPKAEHHLIPYPPLLPHSVFRSESPFFWCIDVVLSLFFFSV